MVDFTDSSIFLWILVCLTCFALGWWWARQEQRQQVLLPSSYLSSMNSLLEDKTTQGLQALQNVAYQHPEMLGLQMSIGRIYRQKGDISQAIQLHQQLLQEPYFSHENKQNIIWELALDYHHAGIYNLAQTQYERLMDSQNYGAQQYFQEMILCSLWALMSLAEQQRQWNLALEYSEKLKYQLHKLKLKFKLKHQSEEFEGILHAIEAKLKNSFNFAITLKEEELSCRSIHYWLNNIQDLSTEIIQLEKDSWQLNDTQGIDFNIETKKARIADGWKWLLQKEHGQHHRILLEHFAFQLTKKREEIAKFIISWITQQDYDFLSKRCTLIIQLITERFKIESQELYFTLWNEVSDVLEKREITFNIEGFEQSINVWKNQGNAFFVLENIRKIHYKKPRLTTLNELLSWKKIVEPHNEDVGITQKLIFKQLQKQRQYHCQSCGFTSQNFYWYCPSCRQWESYSPYRFDEEV